VEDWQPSLWARRLSGCRISGGVSDVDQLTPSQATAAQAVWIRPHKTPGQDGRGWGDEYWLALLRHLRQTYVSFLPKLPPLAKRL